MPWDTAWLGLVWLGLAWPGPARPGPPRRWRGCEALRAGERQLLPGPALRGRPGSASSCSWARPCPRSRGCRPGAPPRPRVEVRAVALIGLFLMKCHFTSPSSPQGTHFCRRFFFVLGFFPGAQCWGEKNPNTSWTTNLASI